MNFIQKRQITAYYLAFFVFGLIISIIGNALPYLAEHTGVSLSRVSLIFTMSSIGFFAGSILSGGLFDKIPGNILLFSAFCISAAAAFFVPVISSFPLLCAVIMVYGFSNSAVVVGCNTLITRVHALHVGQLMNGMHVVSGVGAFLTPIIFSQIIVRTGDVILGYRLYAFIFILVGIYIISTPSPELQGPLKKQDKKSVETHPKVLVLILLILTFMIYIGSEISMNGWIYTYTITLFPAEIGQAGYILSAFWICMTLGRLVSMFIGRKLAPRQLLLINFLGAALGVLILILFSHSLPAIWIGTMVSGFSMGSVFPLLLTFGENTIGLTGKISGIIFAGTSIGGMIFPYINGQFFTKVSPKSTMVSIMSTILIAFLIFILIRIVTAKHEKRG
ncbi:MAG: MFS transporter [Bacteroidetes bacterium]|nr:MFS transporter [Bacteroidota bacterium]